MPLTPLAIYFPSIEKSLGYDVSGAWLPDLLESESRAAWTCARRRRFPPFSLVRIFTMRWASIDRRRRAAAASREISAASS